MASEARGHILGQIRAANAGRSGLAEEDWANLPRDFRRGSELRPEQVLERLTDRLHDYDAQVLRVAADELAEAISRMLTARGVGRVLLPAGVRCGVLPAGFEFVVDEGLSAAEMDGCDGVLTECTLAIAETGTIVLQNVAGQGRRAVSLVPDYHLCLVDAARVVATVPEAIARLGVTSRLPTTFISGPSATADIEMTRIKGVHGPRFLDVILFSA